MFNIAIILKPSRFNKIVEKKLVTNVCSYKVIKWKKGVVVAVISTVTTLISLDGRIIQVST